MVKKLLALSLKKEYTQLSWRIGANVGTTIGTNQVVGSKAPTGNRREAAVVESIGRAHYDDKTE